MLAVRAKSAAVVLAQHFLSSTQKFQAQHRIGWQQKGSPIEKIKATAASVMPQGPLQLGRPLRPMHRPLSHLHSCLRACSPHLLASPLRSVSACQAAEAATAAARTWQLHTPAQCKTAWQTTIYTFFRSCATAKLICE